MLITKRIANWHSRRLISRVHRLMVSLYPDNIDRACAYLGEGAVIYEVAQLGLGFPINRIVITSHDDGGYHIHGETASVAAQGESTNE